jgi:preprotein translocase subunit SecE
MSVKKQSINSPTMGMTKYVHVMFLVGALIIGWLLTNIITSIWASLNLAIAAVSPPSELAAVVVGGIIAVGGAYYLWRHPKVNRLAVEIVSELSKVTWPNRKELSASTVVVIILSIIAAVILGLFDFFWAWVTDLIYGA